MVRIDGLVVVFNQGEPTQNTALQGINLSIHQGEFVTVIGTNGAGKSTLLNAIAGAVPIYSGQIIIDEKTLTKQLAHKRAGLVARVFQDPMAGTCENLSIEQNMALAYGRGATPSLKLALNGKKRAIFRQKLAMLSLGLEHRLTDRVGLLSGGQRQAVSLLMASLAPSKILLLDEHTAALDPKTADFVLGLTKTIVQQNQLTALMVTHSMEQALAYGTRTLMLHQGQIVLDVAGDERLGMTVADLLALFHKNQGEHLSDDRLLLG